MPFNEKLIRAGALAWAGLLAGGPSARADLALAPFATGLGQGVGVVHAGDGSGRLFIVQQTGQIRVHDGTQLLATPFLDIGSLISCCGERGLLGLAFHPQYAANGYFFVDYTNAAGNTVVARYRVSGNPDVADPASATVVLSQPQPFTNHNGGEIAFGPDGYLYVALGDGGSGGDPQDNGQDLGTLLGKILRIDVDSLPYTIPADNPFVANPAARAEIWAWGLRNPWRFSFDRTTGDLFIADVGQGNWEEIDFQPAASGGGENYGWRRMEGAHCYNPATGCNDGTLVLPILEYSHALGCSVTGGYRYRGSQLPSLFGVYLYSDFCSGVLWGATRGQNGSWSAQQLLGTSYNITSFGQDEAGELYVVDQGTGVYRITSTDPTLSIGDVSLQEGNSGTTNAVFTVTLSPPSAETVTVSWATADGTAGAPGDYTASSGSLSFAPWVTTRTASVPILGDILDEPDETLLVSLSGAANATIADAQGQGTILDDDPTPLLSIEDATVTEGDAGTIDAVFTVTLSAPSADPVTVSYATADDTALAGSDYTARSGILTFPAGSTASQSIAVPVLGDLQDEPSERFATVLSAQTSALLERSEGSGLILDDDGGVFRILPLAHGTDVLADLRAQPGPAADADLYLLQLPPRSSFEVMVDGVSGDIGSGNGPRLERLGPDLTSVVASSQAVALGPARSLRLLNTSPLSANTYLRVSSDSCTTGCGPDDSYRIRAWETTAGVARFNDAGAQRTVLVLHNPGAETIAGTAYFWSPSGTLLGSSAFSLSARRTLVLDTTTVPGLAGQSGSLTVAANGSYGTLVGKTVALDPTTGFSFDSPLTPRPR